MSVDNRIDYGFNLQLDPGETARLRRHETMPDGFTVVCQQAIENTAKTPVITSFGLLIGHDGIGRVHLNFEEV